MPSGGLLDRSGAANGAEASLFLHVLAALFLGVLLAG